MVKKKKSGCSHFIFENEQDCFAGVRRLLSYLPQNNIEDPPKRRNFFGEFFERDNLELSEIVPETDKKIYDIKQAIEVIFDKNSFLEIQENFAKNAVVGLAFLDGMAIGVIASQPKVLAGVLDINASDKIARFIRFCDAFNIPLVNLVDVPGYLPGIDQEHGGIIRHGAKILYAFSEATVPKVSLILRKAFGGAYIALCSRFLGFDRIIAWSSAKIGVMGEEQAVKIIYKKEIASAKDPEKKREEKIKEYRNALSCFEAAKLGQVDIVIEPKDTRKTLIESFNSLQHKRESKVARKHGNIPL